MPWKDQNQQQILLTVLSLYSQPDKAHSSFTDLDCWLKCINEPHCRSGRNVPLLQWPSIHHLSFCCCKHSLEHQMYVNLLLKLVPNKCTVTCVTFAKNWWQCPVVLGHCCSLIVVKGLGEEYHEQRGYYILYFITLLFFLIGLVDF